LNPRALSRYASGRPWDEFYSFLSFAGSNDVTAFILTITRVEIARQASRLQLTVRQRFKHADPTSGWLAGKSGHEKTPEYVPAVCSLQVRHSY